MLRDQMACLQNWSNFFKNWRWGMVEKSVGLQTEMVGSLRITEVGEWKDGASALCVHEYLCAGAFKK